MVVSWEIAWYLPLSMGGLMFCLSFIGMAGGNAPMKECFKVASLFFLIVCIMCYSLSGILIAVNGRWI